MGTYLAHCLALADRGFSSTTVSIQPAFAKIRSATERPPASALRTSSERVKLVASLLKNQPATMPPALRSRSAGRVSQSSTFLSGDYCLPRAILEVRCSTRSAISLLVGEQSKHSRNYRQSNQSTDDERYNRMSTRLELLRSHALLRRSDAHPKWEIAHNGDLATQGGLRGAWPA